MASSREYDFVLLGPTGYTGLFCAEHIVQHLPTDLKWALAGRSLQKIESIAADLKRLNPDRAAPDLLAVQLTPEELNPLAKKTKVIINCVGPYHLYSTSVVKACAINGTHYVDATGETPWVRSMVQKYHESAKASGAVIIHSVGVESVPADVLTWSVVKRMHDGFSSPTREVTCCLSDQKTSGPSGGSLSTILTTLESLPLSEIIKTADPFALAASSSPPPRDVPVSTLWEKLSGVRSIQDLGALTTSPTSVADTAIVHRSSTLMPDLYGPRFYFREFLRVRNVLVGVLVHLAVVAAFALLLTRPFQWLAKKVIYAPGSGPQREDSVDDFVEYLAVATEDTSNHKDVSVPPKRILGKLNYRGPLYQFTGLLLAEAALVIARQEEKVKKVSGCGIVTSATLGQDYVDRLDEVGCRIETKVFEN